MYIRRKVFSVALDEYGEERLFSTNEIINEDDYLNEVMYSDYYDDFDERMFAEVTIGDKKYNFDMNQMKEIAKKEGIDVKQKGWLGEVRSRLNKEGVAKKYKKMGTEYTGAVKTSQRGQGVVGQELDVVRTGKYTNKQKKDMLAEARKLAKKAEKNTDPGKARYTETTPYHRADNYRNSVFKDEAQMAKLDKMGGRVRRADLKRALTGRNAKIAYGVGAAAGLGYGGYRLYKNHKSQED